MFYKILFALLLTNQAFSQEISPISIDRNGEETSVEFIYHLSEDGRYFVFSSNSNNIVDGDSNRINRGPFERGPAEDVFLLDRETNEYQRVSLTHDGRQIEDGESILLSASNNLNRLLYYSVGISQFPGDTRIADWDPDFDLYIYDDTSKQTTWLTTSPDGKEADFETSIGDVSGNGRYAVVYTLSSNLLRDTVPNDSANQFILFDTETNDRELISQSVDGIQQNASHNRNRFRSAVNFDGNYIAFYSYATNLTNEGIGGLFLWNRETQTTELISRDPDGNPIEFEEFFEPDDLDISDDGRYLFFVSSSNQHVTNDPHPDERRGSDGFIYDRVTKETKVVPLGEYDSPERLRGASNGSISANGRFVVFVTRVNNGDAVFPELFLYDQQTDSVELLLLQDSNHPLFHALNIYGIPRVTSDGKYVLFSNAVYEYGFLQSSVLYLMTRDVTTSHVDAWDAME